MSKKDKKKSKAKKANLPQQIEQGGYEAPPCQLYLISPEDLGDIDVFASLLTRLLETGLPACFQLRLKGASEDVWRAAITRLMPICHDHDVAFILNDRLDLALEFDVDGVHLGQEDGDLRDAREKLGPNKNLGISCHNSLHLAFEAGDIGADYVAFGAFYPSPTKATAKIATLEILQQWDEITHIPSVAIGGIRPENAAPIIEAGAHFLAVSSGVWAYEAGALAAVKAFGALFDRIFEGDSEQEAEAGEKEQ